MEIGRNERSGGREARHGIEIPNKEIIDGGMVRTRETGAGRTAAVCGRLTGRRRLPASGRPESPTVRPPRIHGCSACQGIATTDKVSTQPPGVEAWPGVPPRAIVMTIRRARWVSLPARVSRLVLAGCGADGSEAATDAGAGEAPSASTSPAKAPERLSE